ncbi:MAG: HesA/MoeB/ThiF family protein [Clostridiales bacterium]|jgi:molybdopterin/thiamine biosynthesis adenylyltransferase|nr:HesA/MoeB/ThiF family protein [Clostridiales bacterium]
MNERYARQLILPEIGTVGQNKLLKASVLVIGAGGLGSPALQYLAAAGVGKIGVMDGDTVSLSNLNRQILYSKDDIGKPKALCAAGLLKKINGEIEIIAYPELLTNENAQTIIKNYDMVALCTDSVDARKITNYACVKTNTPYVDGAVSGFSGTLLTVIPGQTACYECIYGSAIQPEGPTPILGAMAGWVGCAEALAVTQLILGVATKGIILFFDGIKMATEEIEVAKDPNCKVCG